MPSVNVTINGKSYRMACDEGQEDHLLGLAEQLNKLIDELRGSFGEIGDLRLVVMAAITMADDRSEARRRIERIEAEMKALNASAAAAGKRLEASDGELAAAIADAAQRITAIARRLNAAE